MTDNTLFTWQVLCSPDAAVFLENMLDAESYQISVRTFPGDSGAEIYFNEKSAALDFESSLEDMLKQVELVLHEKASYELIEIEKEDWSESWKQYFHAKQVSPRVIVKPSWEELDIEATECIIEIDPGMSFGTGQHGTTVACLKFIDELSDGRTAPTLIDIGCGSGILTIAALKLGFERVDSFDFDPDAVMIAKENLEKNDLMTNVYIQDLSKYEADFDYDFVVVNIESRILIQHSDRIIKALKKEAESVLVLSGILAKDFDEFKSHYLKHYPLEVIEEIQLDEWRSASFRYLV